MVNSLLAQLVNNFLYLQQIYSRFKSHLLQIIKNNNNKNKKPRRFCTSIFHILKMVGGGKISSLINIDQLSYLGIIFSGDV